MNHRLLFFAVAILSVLATPASAARPGGSGVSNPQIAYVKSSTSGRRQLVVANEDGSGATVIHTTNQFLRTELGPNNTVYLWDGGQFGKMPATGGAIQWLFEIASRFGGNSDLSPDGSSLAWINQAGGTLNLYDIASGNNRAVAIAPEFGDVSFDRTGANIIFSVPLGDGNYEFRIVSVNGGSAVPYGLTGRYSNFDASHRDSTLVLSVNPPGGIPYLALWEPGMGAPFRLVDGYNGTYRCDDTAIIYQRVVGSGSTLFRRTSTGAITTVAKPEAVFPSYKQLC